MTWECAECQAGEGHQRRIDAVCHHCCKLLCHQDRVLMVDAAFDPAGGGAADQTAVHCRACSRQHHSRIDTLFGRSDQ
jgi:hypothetical protein